MNFYCLYFSPWQIDGEVNEKGNVENKIYI